MVLKKIRVDSVGKTIGCLFAPVGLVYGFFVAFVLLMKSGDNLEGGLGLGFLVMIALPIAFGLAGMICGLVLAVGYNFAASITGGIVLEIAERPQNEM